MRIGIDFDNTLVCYDGLFWTLARERSLIDDSLPKRKDAVRDHLRQSGLEAEWTRMQAEAYGPQIESAVPFPGVDQALTMLQARHHEIFVISHKTRHPISGPDYDLHRAARDWLASRVPLQFPGVTFDRVYFEIEKCDKLQRIRNLDCDLFIDDLPELLQDERFPTGVRKVLFDPHRQASPSLTDVERFHHWNELPRLLEADTLR